MAATTSNAFLNSYAGSNGTPTDLFIRDVSAWTQKLQRVDTPLVKAIKSGPVEDIIRHKLEWGWGSPNPRTDTLGATINAAATTLTVTDSTRFQVGDVIELETEQMQVSALASATTLTVSRGYAGTTAAAHNSTGDYIYIIAPAIYEGQSTPTSPITQGEVDYNYFQQFEFSFKLSQRARLTPTYESKNFAGDREEQQLRKMMQDEAPRALEAALLRGQRSIGTSALAPSLGGIFQPSYNTTNTSITGLLTEYKLMDALQTVYNRVGVDNMGKTLMAHPTMIRVISSWYQGMRRSSVQDTSVRTYIDEIDTGWFGKLKLVPNYLMNSTSAGAQVAMNKLIVLNWSDYELIPYCSGCEWGDYYISAVDGWWTHRAVRGIYALRAQNPDSRLVLSGFSVTAADYPTLAAA